MPSLSDIKVHISTDADTKGIDETERALGGFSAKSAAIMGLVSGAAQSLVNDGINLITNSVGDAVKRVDTLNNAGRTFENMGFSAQATKGMMHDLDMSIRGLPTSLSDAVGNVELLTGSTQDIGKSRKIFDALNDGILGFGGSAVQVNGAIIQISQAFSNGKIDAQTWNSLIQNGMGPALNVLAKQMGMTTGAFKEGLSNGSISVGQFQDALIQLDTKGGGGMASLQKIAHDSTSGIGTGMENAKTAVTRGMADIIQAVGSKNISDAISKTGKDFEITLKYVALAITTVIGVIQTLNGFFEQHRKVITEVVAVITALFLPALVAFGVRSLISIGIYIASMVTAGVTSLIAGAQMMTAWLMALGPIGLVIAVAIAAAALIIMNWDAVRGFLIRVWNDVRGAWSQASGFFSSIGGSIVGAFSWVTGQIGGLFSGAYNGIINLFRNLPRELGSIVSNAFGSVSNSAKSTLHGLHIPGFASGVRNFSGGMALVGEQGPELVSLPSGSNVYSNNESGGMIGGSSTTSTYNIQSVVLSTADATAEFFKIQDRNGVLASKGLSIARAY